MERKRYKFCGKLNKFFQYFFQTTNSLTCKIVSEVLVVVRDFENVYLQKSISKLKSGVVNIFFLQYMNLAHVLNTIILRIFFYSLFIESLKQFTLIAILKRKKMPTINIIMKVLKIYTIKKFNIKVKIKIQKFTKWRIIFFFL